MIKIVLEDKPGKRVKRLGELQKNGELCISYKRITEQGAKKNLTNKYKSSAFKIPIFLSKEKYGHF